MFKRLVILHVTLLAILAGCATNYYSAEQASPRTSQTVEPSPLRNQSTARRSHVGIPPTVEAPAVAAEPTPDNPPSSRLQRDPLAQPPFTNGASWSGVATRDDEPLFDLPIVWNKRVRAQIERFLGRERRTLTKWLGRTGRYFPLMRSIMRDEGLPEDLVYLALIESGLSMKAYSRKRATGPWQFIRATGKKFGLRIDWWVDERRDPVKSTRAAARYLKHLHARYGDWMLALAAYNAGERRVDRAIREAKSHNYWYLAARKLLPPETRRYIPRLMAAAIIARHPTFYGFTDIAYHDALEFDTARVPARTNIPLLAKGLGVSFDDLHRLNPALRRRLTPPRPSRYALRIPAGASARLAAVLARLDSGQASGALLRYRVSSGENLWGIARRYGVSLRELAALNSLRRPERLYAGQMLLVPTDRSRKRPARKRQRPVTPPSKLARAKVPLPTAPVGKIADAQAAASSGRIALNAKRFHTVRRGETLWKIAQRYDLSVRELRQANDGLVARRMNIGLQLTIPAKRTGSPVLASAGRSSTWPSSTRQSASDSPPLSSKRDRVTGANNDEFSRTDQRNGTAPHPQPVQKPPTAAAQSVAFISHVVRRGDNVWRIARKYEISVKSLHEANAAIRSSRWLKIGQRLRIPMTFAVQGNGDLKSGTRLNGYPGNGLSETGQVRRNGSKPPGVVPGVAAPQHTGNTVSATDRYHIVRRGESLWQIAQRYGMTLTRLRQLNHLGGRSRIYPGDRLRLPGE